MTSAIQNSGRESSGAAAVLRGAHRPDLLRAESLSDILTATAKRCPKKTALIWEKREISYEDLDSLSNAIGAALAVLGAKPGAVIGLMMPRGADLLIAQAGIAKSGAAWLPFDAETPVERVKTCLQSANAIGILTCAEWLPKFSGIGVPVWSFENLPAGQTPTPPEPGDPAYVIYTSGSTGQPKGIVISHRSICHFLRSENEILGVRESDRVYQGFSLAFDMSFEEIWISYLAGATLWLAPPQMVRDPAALARALHEERITVWHAVPTLAGMVEDELPGIRLINLGGEACPDALAQRLVRPGREVFNTYGPTETAVSATIAELKRGEPVTIGKPLPNYGILLVDEDRRPLPSGAVGELAIFGPGLAAGYLGKPELTAERFVPNPLAASTDEKLMYLTGDLGRIGRDGTVQCLGRADNQVKIRGFRVELDEIAAAISAHPGVAAAAVVMRVVAEVDQLVGFVSNGVNQTIDPAELRRALTARLPAYMVPTHFEILPNLPRLTSGKIDQNALRRHPLTFPTENTTREGVLPVTEEETVLFAAIVKLFPSATWNPEADFFDDLGGHSLLAARLTSILRADPRYATLGVQDVYGERTLGRIARALKRESRRARPDEVPWPQIPARRRFFCGLAQAVTIPFLVLLHIADWLAPFFVYNYYTGDPDSSIPLAVVYSLSTFVVVLLLTFPVAIIGKWLAAGRLKAGEYPLWGVAYFRWWLAEKFCELPDLYLISGTPWMSFYLRSLGARVGRHVQIDTVTIGAPELLTIGDGASVGSFVNMENARVERGRLILGPVELARDAAVDSYAVLENDTRIGVGAQLGGLSALGAGQRIPDGQHWEGSPARPVNRPREPLPPRPTVNAIWRIGQAAVFGVTAVAVSMLFFVPSFPAFMLIDFVDAHTLDIFDSDLGPLAAFGFFLLVAIPASALFVGVTLGLTALMRWMLRPQKEGIYSIYGYSFWRRKFTSLVLDNSLQVLHGLYASIYAPTWLRLLGVKVGRHAEVSTAEGMAPELLSLGDDSFVADAAMLGDEENRGGWIKFKRTSIGNRTFIGNGAYVPSGASVPDNVLIGVQTRTPDNETLKSGQTWMGSPAFLLPARECLTGFDASLTFRPSRKRRMARGAIEAMRIILPLAIVIATGYLIVVMVMPIASEEGWGWKVAGALSAAGCLFGLASFLLVVALKWILVGRYKPCARAMWTPFVWLSEAVTNLYESLAVPNFLDVLRGTPMLPWALRLLGARIGRGVYLNTTDLTEFDCVRIGDEAELNAWSGPQTHLFEDRIMKIGVVEIGARTTVGTRTTILYDTHVGERVTLGPLTLVAKGERLPAGTRWEGSPASSK